MEPSRAWFFDFMGRYSFEAKRVSRRLAALSLLAAVVVYMASLTMTPRYETVAQVGVDYQQEDRGYQTLEFRGPTADALMPAIMHTVDSHHVAHEVIYRLGLEMTSEELLDNLAVEQVDSYRMNLRFEDTDPERARQVVNTLGRVVSEITYEGDNTLAANVYEKAALPATPVHPKPLRNGLLTLAIGLGLCAVPGRVLPGVSARLAGGRGTADPRPVPRVVERVREKKLLRALGRRGKLTVLEAALEAELSVEEAGRMLSDLVNQGHLQPGIKDGRHAYSFWGEDRA